jgi:hypothetical protein
MLIPVPLLLAMAGGIVTVAGHSPSATPEPNVDDWLFTLNFRAAQLAVTDATTRKSTLVLHGVDTDVLAFTDQSQRRATKAPVDFLLEFSTKCRAARTQDAGIVVTEKCLGSSNVSAMLGEVWR